MNRPFRARRRRGAHAIEFALIAPVMTYMIFAGMDFAWYFVADQELQRAVHHAAEVGAQAPTGADPVQEAYADLVQAFQEGAVLPSLDARANAQVAGAFLQVDATATFRPLLGVVPLPGNLRSSRRIPLESAP